MGTNFLKKTAVLAALLCVSTLASCGKTSYLQDSGDSFAAEKTASSEESTFGGASSEDGSFGGEGTGTEEAAGGGTEDSEELTAIAKTVYVEAAGAVVSPGVYQVPAGSRVFEVIALAGGLSADADTSDINQAAEVSDGQKLYVRRQGEAVSPAAASGSASSSSADSVLVNINTADAALLQTLPGVGAAKAEAIIAYRTEKGPFKKTADLKKISGIKDGLFNKISDKITV